MLKRLTLITALLCAGIIANAQNDFKRDTYLGFEFRYDYFKSSIDGEPNDANSGFRGKVINLKLNGTLTEHISYNFRHRLNKPNTNASFFDATDFFNLSYDNENWRFTAGKQTYLLGGFEYDLAAIDFYYMSEFSSQFPCYHFAVTSTYKTGKDELTFQLSHSPYTGTSEGYSYNFFWKGHHDWFSSTWSANILENAQREYIKYIALGNQATFGKFVGFVDLMSRSPLKSEKLGLNYSIICKLAYSPSEKLNIFAKASQDVSNWAAGTTFDQTVLPGTNVKKIGGGVEIWPSNKLGKDLRIHANAHYATGTNTNKVSAGNVPGELIFNIGLTWRFRVL